MSHIFISYSRKDTDCVDRVYKALKDNDFKVWLDRREIEFGDDWVEQIVAGIDEAEIFLLFWSASAKASQYVEQEMKSAQNCAFGTRKKLKIYTVRLDDTNYPSMFSHLQAADMSSSGCSDTAIQAILGKMPTHLRNFNYAKTLGDQPHENVPETPLVRVPWSTEATWGMQAAIIGRPAENLPKPPKILNLCLQFTRDVNLEMIRQVYASLDETAGPIWMLHITGPTDDKGEKYVLDPQTTDQWQAACDYIHQTVREVANDGSTTLRVFAPIPGALLASAMRRFDRFWHVQFYHFDARLDDKKKYWRVVDQTRQ